MTAAAFVDPWRGFAVDHPAGWRAVFPPIDGVAFVAPDGSGFAELSMIETADAPSAVRQRMATFPPLRSRELSSTPEQAALAFDDGRTRGEVHARWTAGRAACVLAQVAAGSPIEPNQLVTDLVGSLRPVDPTPRSRWIEPTEQAFSLLQPDGWHVQSLIRPSSGGRELCCRVSRDLQTFAAVEPAMAGYVNGPPELPFDISLPLDGLQPLLQQVVRPQLTQAYGVGVELLGYDSFADPLRGEARFALPDGTIRVLQLLAVTMPGMNRWIGGAIGCYQAPESELAGLEPVLRGVLDSTKTSPQWQAREQGRRQQHSANQLAEQQQWANLQQDLHRQRMGDIARSGAANTAIHQQRMALHDQQFAAYQQASVSSDQGHHDTINAVRGASDYLDAGSGRVYNVADGYERVWTDTSGQLFAGDWSIDPPADWTELRRLP